MTPDPKSRAGGIVLSGTLLLLKKKEKEKEVETSTNQSPLVSTDPQKNVTKGQRKTWTKVEAVTKR